MTLGLAVGQCLRPPSRRREGRGVDRANQRPRGPGRRGAPGDRHPDGSGLARPELRAGPHRVAVADPVPDPPSPHRWDPQCPPAQPARRATYGHCGWRLGPARRAGYRPWARSALLVAGGDRRVPASRPPATAARAPSRLCGFPGTGRGDGRHADPHGDAARRPGRSSAVTGPGPGQAPTVRELSPIMRSCS